MSMFLRSVEIGTRSPIIKSAKDFFLFWTKLSNKYSRQSLNSKVDIFIPMKFRKWDEQMTPDVPDSIAIDNESDLHDSMKNDSKSSAELKNTILNRNSKFRVKDSPFNVFDQESSDDIDILNWQITMVNEMNAAINVIESTVNKKTNENSNSGNDTKLLQTSIVPCVSLRMFDDLNQVSNCLDGFKRASSVFNKKNDKNSGINSILMVGGPSSTIFSDDNNNNKNSQIRMKQQEFKDNAWETVLASGILQDYGINTIWFGGYPEGNVHRKDDFQVSLNKLKNKMDLVNKHCKAYINNVSLITQLCLDYDAIIKLCENDIIKSNCNEIRIGTPHCPRSKLLYYGKVCGVGKNTMEKFKESGNKQDKNKLFDIENEFIKPLTNEFEKQGKSSLLSQNVTGIHIFDFKANAELAL